MIDINAARAAAERALALILAGRSPQPDNGAVAALARYVLELAEEAERLREVADRDGVKLRRVELERDLAVSAFEEGRKTIEFLRAQKRDEQASDHSDVGEDYEDADMPRGWWLVIMIFCGGILAALIGLVMWRLR